MLARDALPANRLSVKTPQRDGKLIAKKPDEAPKWR
jgi:hypothetical protein